MHLLIYASILSAHPEGMMVDPNFRGKNTVDVEEVLTIGLTEGQELFSIAGIAIDGEKNIYLSDAMDYSIKKFEPSGRMLARIGRRGNGPGEFKSPATCVVWRDTIAVIQMNSPTIQFFTAQDLHYIKSVRTVTGLPVDIAFDGQGRFYLPVLAETEHACLVVCDGISTAAQKQVFLKENEKQNALYNAFKLAIDARNTLVVAYTFLDRIDLCGVTGRLLESFKVSGGESKSADDNGIAAPEETFVRSVQTDNQGNIWLLAGSMFPHEGRDVFVISRRGAPLFSFELPYKSRMIALDSDGYVYGTAEEGTLLKKYRVHQKREK